jgi:ATP-dependent DNA helicase 2 subunit 2
MLIVSQGKNEGLLRELAEGCDGVYGTLEQAVSEMDIPRVKQVRPTPTFKGFLQLGNPEEYETAARIPVERYFRTYTARAPPASSFVLRSDIAPGPDEGEPSTAAPMDNEPDSEGGKLTNVRPLRSYQISDESAPGGKVDVEQEELAKGYEYGRTAVHISETDLNITTLETIAAMELVGFVQSAQVSVPG